MELQKAKEQKAEKIQEPADVQYQLAKFKREHPEWQGKDAVGTSRNVVRPSDDTSPCPPTPAASKTPKKCTCRIKLVWTTCKGLGTHSAVRGDSFRDRHRAEFAAAEYKSCHGWTPFISFCEQCSAFHLYHDPQKKLP
jgi:hypothetical protein